MGRGAGYYDRYLSQASQALRVSFAFDAQVMDRVAQDVWDEKVDWIITESQMIFGSRILEEGTSSESLLLKKWREWVQKKVRLDG